MASGRRTGSGAMSPFEFLCAGERLEALPSGALYWPARRLLAVADLHLEKGSSYAVNALKLLPRHDTRQTLSTLATLIEALNPERVICLGDSFHDREAVERLPKQERAEIESLTKRVRFVWIAGNHDPGPPPQGWGTVAEEIADAPLVFRHEARFGLPDGEISGHFHPVAALTVRGGSHGTAEGSVGLASGVAGGLLAAASYAGTTLLARFAVPRYGALRVLLLEIAGGTLILGIVLPLAGHPPAPPPTVGGWIYIAALVLGPVLGANFLFFAGVRRIDAAPTAVAATIEPVVGALLALLLFDQHLSGLGWLGLAMVVFGVAGGYLEEAQEKRDQTT